MGQLVLLKRLVCNFYCVFVTNCEKGIIEECTSKCYGRIIVINTFLRMFATGRTLPKEILVVASQALRMSSQSSFSGSLRSLDWNGGMERWNR